MDTISTDSWHAPALAREHRSYAPMLPPRLIGDGGIGGASDSQSLRIDLTPVERILRKTRSVALGQYRCPVDHPQFLLGGGPHTCSYIAFHRTSVRMRIGDSRPEVTTPNNVTFYTIGQSYSREAIGAEGDDCDWLALSPELLRSLQVDLAPDTPANVPLFARPFAPIRPAAFFAQRRLFATAASAAAPMNSLQIEEAVTDLVGIVVADARAFWGLSGRSRRRPRPVCHRRRLQIIEEAKSMLARDYGTDLSLADLARKLHCSPAHLSRMFHSATGFKLCDYRQELRLRKGLFLLEESGLEIGDIAVQVGFASHSHFTSAFHRRFGINPSQFLKWKSRKLIHALATYR